MRGFRKTDPLIQESIDYLDERFPFWLTKVLNIGQPIMDDSVTSAAIQYDKATGDFTFRMNPDFAATLSVEERAFLASHEAMHVVRNDMKLHADPRFPDKAALNKAMDAVINDTLRNAGLTPPEWAVNGPRDLGIDTEDMDVEDVYEIVKAMTPPQSSEDDGEGEEGEGGESKDKSDDADKQKDEGEGSQSKDDSDSDPSDGEDSESGEGSDDSQSDGDPSEGDLDESESDDDAEGESGEGEDESEGEGDEGEGSGDPSEGDLDPTESEDEGEGGDGGEGDTDNAGDDGDGDGEGDSEGSQATGDRPMNGGGHEDWDADMSAAAEDFHDADRDGDQSGEVGAEGEGGDAMSGKYSRPEGEVTRKDLDRLDFEALFRIVEPEIVDGFGLGLPPKSDWRRPRRNMMGVWPQTTLPSKRDDRSKLALASKRMQIVVCLDNSGSVSPNDIALFREVARRLPEARADYIFVVGGSTATEITRDRLFDAKQELPYVGGGAYFGETRGFAVGHNCTDRDAEVNADMKRTAEVMLRPGFRQNKKGTGTPTYYENAITEFDSMHAWMVQAVERGRLRQYPKAVLVISDAQSMLTSATFEEAAGWRVIHNAGMMPHFNPAYGEMKADGSGRDYSPKPMIPAHVDPVRRGKGGDKIGRDCRVPVENIHRLGDLILNETHTRKKARV